MMVHSNVQSVGSYEGKDATFSDDYGNLGMTHRQQVNDNLLLVNQIMTNWGLTDRLSVTQEPLIIWCADMSRIAVSTR